MYFVSPPIVTNGLSLHVDAASQKSYPGSGGVWTDLSKQTGNGTLQNSITFITNNAGGFSLNGTNTYVTFPAKTLTSVTLDCWFTPISKGSGFGYALFYGTSASAGGAVSIAVANQVYGTTLNLGEVYCFVGGGDPQLRRTNYIVTFGQPMHVIMSATNGSTTISCYINGVSVPITNTNVFSFGTTVLAGLDGGFNNFFKGNIHSAKIYNRVLTQAEVTQNFNAGRGRFGL